MKITIMSSYHQECGIAEYAEKIRLGFEHNGHDVKVLGNYPYKALTLEDDEKVFRCFHVEIHDKKNDWNTKQAIEFTKDTDILLIQYESSLYPSSTFNQFLERYRQEVDCKIVVVFHSSCIWPSFPWHLIDCGIAHDRAILGCIPHQNRCIVKHGMIDYPDRDPKELRKEFGLDIDTVTIGSFGLGRVQYKETIPAVTSVGCQYLISSPSSESNRLREMINNLPEEQKKLVYYYSDYVERDELVRRIQACDIILLYYPPVGAAVCSGAVRMAIGARRRVAVSNTNWFADLIGTDFTCVIKEECDVERLKVAMDMLKKIVEIHGYKIGDSQKKYIEENSWNNITKNQYIPIFEKLWKQ